jgi:hypothetical protein
VAHPLRTGLQVITFDGVELGVIAEVRDRRFRVWNGQESRWLRTDAALDSDGYALRLICNGRLGTYYAG